MKTCGKCKYCIGYSKTEPIKVMCKIHKDKLGVKACGDYKHYGPFEIIK